MIISKVQKWGNSQGLRLSRQVLDLADIAVGDSVEVLVEEHQIVIKKPARPRVVLADLVARIPTDYPVEEVDFGPPVGREAW